MGKTYAEKLRDPRWQKKRLQILERDEWTCQDCKDTESTLHVHHFYYERGKNPWEYPDKHLITLCKPCHEWQEETQLEVLKRISDHKFTIWYHLSGTDFAPSMLKEIKEEAQM